MPNVTGQKDESAGILPTFAAQPIGSTGKSDYRMPVSEAGAVEAKTLGAAGEFFGKMAEESFKADQTEAGKVAGLDPDYRPSVFQTEAYKKAALSTYGNQLEAKTRAAVDTAYRDYMNLPRDARDPAAFTKTLEEQKQALLKADVFAQAQPDFEKHWAALSQTYSRSVLDDHDRAQLDQAKAATLQNLNATSDVAHRVASLPTSRQEEIDAQIAAHSRLVDAAVNQGQISATAGVETKEKFKQSLLQTQGVAVLEATRPEDRAAALDKFKAAYGGDYFAQLRSQESGGNDAAKAATSSAQGRYQFTTDTWRSLMRSHPELGLTADGRTDPDQQEKAVRAFTADNAAELRAAGFDANNPNLYMAHFLGAGGAKNFLRALAKNPDAAASPFFPDAAAANPDVFKGRTLAEVYARQTRRFGAGDAAGMSPETYAYILGKGEQMIRADAHQAAQARTAALNDIDAAKRQIADGYDVTPSEWSRLSSLYGASPDAATKAAFEQASQVRSMLAGFQGQPPQVVEARIAAMQASFKDGGTAQERELVVDASKWLTAYRNDINKDPVQRYARDFGKQIAPLDFSTPEALAATLHDRQAPAEQAAKAYGLPAPRLLLESEKSAFKTLAANGGPQMIAAAGAAMKALGPRGAALLKEIGDDAPAFAQAARVSAWGGEKGFLDDFAEYHRLSSDPATRKAMELPERAAATPILDKTIGASLYALPDLAAAARVSAVQTYELRAFRNGWDKALLDASAKDALARTTQEALGATFSGGVQYGGVATRSLGYWAKDQLLLPGNLRANKLSDVVAALRDDDFTANPPLHADNRPATAETVKTGRFLSVGRGKYEVYDRDPLSKDAKPLRDAAGKPWVLDLNALEDRLRARVAGAYR
ncbi:MAG: hypothetical protein ACR650_09820 [Methylocystis sp.]